MRTLTGRRWNRVVWNLSLLMLLGWVIFPIRGQAVQWPIADVPHNDTYVVGTYYDFRDRLEGQPDGEVGSFHHAVDIRATHGSQTPVIAVAPGKVRFRVMNFTEQERRDRRYQGSIKHEPKTYFHRIDVSDLTDESKIWAYLHVTRHYHENDPQYPWWPGEDVFSGDHLGMIASPTDLLGNVDPSLAHVHLSRRRYTSSVLFTEAYAVGIQNPLELLDGYTDSHSPIIPGAHGTDELKFRNNIQTGPEKEYFSKKIKPFPSWPWDRYYAVSGQVDILANINDWTDPSWKGAAGPYKVGYQVLREMEDGSTIPYSEIETFAAVGQGVTTEAPTNDLVAVIYEKSGDASVNSCGVVGAEQFIYIVTNTDQDGTIEMDDTLGCWNTASVSVGGVPYYPDGNYRVRIFAEDISGNLGEYTSESKWLAVHNEGAVDVKTTITQKSPGGGAIRQTTIYEAEWVDGDLNVTVNEQCRPQQSDSLLVDIVFSEPMYPDSVVVELLGAAPVATYPVVELGWQTEEFGNDHWKGCVPTVAWDAMRNRMKGERRIRVHAWDLAGAMLDTDPTTYAHWDTT